MTEADRPGPTAGTFSRAAARQALVVGLAGGLVSRLSPAAPDAAARKGRLSTLWAGFTADGTIGNAKGGDRIQSGSIGTGASAVFFTRDVSRCALTASINTEQRSRLISINPVAGIPRAVEIRTSLPDGNTSHQAFRVLVVC
jgi:hypothetical protein